MLQQLVELHEALFDPSRDDLRTIFGRRAYLWLANTPDPVTVTVTVDPRLRQLVFAQWLGSRSPRNAAICARYMAGHKLRDIARDYGVTPQRIRQIVWRLAVDGIRFRRIG